MDSCIRIGIIGLGVGTWHLEEFSRLEGAEVTALADLNREKLEQNAEKYGIPNTYSEYEELIEHAPVDAVSICLPNFLHEPASVTALQAGKHVLCEKPLAHTLESGKRIREAVDEAGTVFMLAMKFRYEQGARLIRRLFDEGAFGKVYYGLNRYTRPYSSIPPGWFHMKEKSGGGAVIDNGVHLLDLNWFLMGCPEPEEVSAGVSYDIAEALSQGSSDVEDFAGGVIRFKNGSVILIENAWAAHVREEIFEVRILGTEGGAQTHPELDIILKNRDVPQADKEPFETQFEHFVSCIREKRTPDTDIESGLRVMEMLEAIYTSGETGRAVRLD